MTKGRDGTGYFVSFEGIEGSGKSTQLRLLVAHLQTQGATVTENQEPGGTLIGRQIRRILLDPDNNEMAAMTELLLMFGSRAQAAKETILPALLRGETVVSDRFTDSTMAYQGFARGLGFDTVRAAHQLALGSLVPDLTICVDVDVETGLQRALQRNLTEPSGLSKTTPETRMDQQSLDFHRKVAEGYQRIAAAEPQRFRLVDGRGSVEEVAARVRRLVRERYR